MNRQDLQTIVDTLPEKFDPEQLIDRLYLRAKLERAEEAIQRGEVAEQDEVVRQTQQWFE